MHNYNGAVLVILNEDDPQQPPDAYRHVLLQEADDAVCEICGYDVQEHVHEGRVRHMYGVMALHALDGFGDYQQNCQGCLDAMYAHVNPKGKVSGMESPTFLYSGAYGAPTQWTEF